MAETIRDTLAARQAQSMQRKVIKESTKQRDPALVNPRVWNMFKEAIDFKAQAVSPFQRQLADLEIATLDFIDGVLPLLNAPLPRVWETVEGGLAEPIRTTVSHNHPHLAGGDYNDSVIRAASTDYEARLQLKVRLPLAQWMDALETVRERFPELERLRGRLESRAKKISRSEKKGEREARRSIGVKRGSKTMRTKRKGVAGLFAMCARPHADEGLMTRRRHGRDTGSDTEYDREAATSEAGGGTMPRGSTGGGYSEDVDDREVRSEYTREDMDMKLKDRQRKLEAASSGFMEEERLMYEQLSGLCRDAAWTKSYIAAALLMTKELFQEAVYSLGDTLQPLPACKSINARGAPAPLGEEVFATAAGYEVPQPGELGSNMIYNASMPDFATRHTAQRTLDDLKAAASRRLHAVKAVAQPLELHAHPEARPGDRVPPARRGLTDRPLTAVAQAGGASMGGSTLSTPRHAAHGTTAGAVTAPMTPGVRA